MSLPWSDPDSDPIGDLLAWFDGYDPDLTGHRGLVTSIA